MAPFQSPKTQSTRISTLDSVPCGIRLPDPFHQSPNPTYIGSALLNHLTHDFQTDPDVWSLDLNPVITCLNRWVDKKLCIGRRTYWFSRPKDPVNRIPILITQTSWLGRLRLSPPKLSLPSSYPHPEYKLLISSHQLTLSRLLSTSHHSDASNPSDSLPIRPSYSTKALFSQAPYTSNDPRPCHGLHCLGF